MNFNMLSLNIIYIYIYIYIHIFVFFCEGQLRGNSSKAYCRTPSTSRIQPKKKQRELHGFTFRCLCLL